MLNFGLQLKNNFMATGKSMKLQNDEILQLRGACQNFINRHPARTPFHHALERTLKQTKRAFEDFADEESEIRVSSALLDKDGKFILNDKQDIQIDPAKATGLQKKMRELNRKEVEVTIYQSTFVPTLDAAWIQQFLGYVIEEDYYDKNMVVAAEKNTELKDLEVVS